MFFSGTFEHTLDERGRIAIPARYRTAFVDGGVLRRGPEGCIEMYSQEAFDAEVQRRLGAEVGNRSTASRLTRREFLADTYTFDVDRQSRVLVPPQLRDENTESAGRILIIGCGDYLELWHPDRWAEERARIAAARQNHDNQHEDER